jgi:hypothetical protein
MNNLVLLVPEIVHVLMAIITFLNSSVIWQHLNKEDTTMPTPISQIKLGCWFESFTSWVRLSQAEKQMELKSNLLPELP